MIFVLDFFIFTVWFKSNDLNKSTLPLNGWWGFGRPLNETLLFDSAKKLNYIEVEVEADARGSNLTKTTPHQRTNYSDVVVTSQSDLQHARDRSGSGWFHGLFLPVDVCCCCCPVWLTPRLTVCRWILPGRCFRPVILLWSLIPFFIKRLNVIRRTSDEGLSGVKQKSKVKKKIQAFFSSEPKDKVNIVSASRANDRWWRRLLCSWMCFVTAWMHSVARLRRTMEDVSAVAKFLSEFILFQFMTSRILPCFVHVIAGFNETPEPGRKWHWSTPPITWSAKLLMSVVQEPADCRSLGRAGICGTEGPPRVAVLFNALGWSSSNRNSSASSNPKKTGTFGTFLDASRQKFENRHLQIWTQFPSLEKISQHKILLCFERCAGHIFTI